jgi:hypothetical protein
MRSTRRAVRGRGERFHHDHQVSGADPAMHSEADTFSTPGRNPEVSKDDDSRDRRAVWLAMLIPWALPIAALLGAPDSEAWAQYPPSIGHAAGISFGTLMFDFTGGAR